jgi:hypothetical protein
MVSPQLIIEGEFVSRSFLVSLASGLAIRTSPRENAVAGEQYFQIGPTWSVVVSP